MSDGTEPLAIDGKRIDRRLLEKRLSQRCNVPECQSWCCTGGVWLDLGQKENILANADMIKPYLPSERRDESQWFDGETEEHADYPSGRGEGTAVVADQTHPAGQTCIFLRLEDRHCALQTASIAKGEHPWALKPFYCALHPITIEGDFVRLDDDNEIYLEGGHCQRPGAESIPLYDLFERELRLALGDGRYEKLRRVAGGGLPTALRM